MSSSERIRELKIDSTLCATPAKKISIIIIISFFTSVKNIHKNHTYI